MKRKHRQDWEGLQPAPIEFFHAKIVALFHEWRKTQTESTSVTITGIELNNIVARAKTETYLKYSKQNLGKPIPNKDM